MGLSTGVAWARADSSTLPIDMCTSRPFNSPCIVGLNARYATRRRRRRSGCPQGFRLRTLRNSSRRLPPRRIDAADFGGAGRSRGQRRRIGGRADGRTAPVAVPGIDGEPRPAHRTPGHQRPAAFEAEGRRRRVGVTAGGAGHAGTAARSSSKRARAASSWSSSKSSTPAIPSGP